MELPGSVLRRGPGPALQPPAGSGAAPRPARLGPARLGSALPAALGPAASGCARLSPFSSSSSSSSSSTTSWRPPPPAGMEAIEELAIQPCTSSLYLRPFRLCYRQNGTKKFWDFMRTHDSVSILIFNTSRQCFVVVKQFRPAVYMCEVERLHPQVFQHQDSESFSHLEDPLPAVEGVTYELCAGIVDKPDLSLEEIACGEVLEECGYRVPATDLRRITSYRSGVGVTGSRQTLFYAEVTDQMRTGEGGGQPEEGELIEVVEIPLEDSMKFAYDETLPKTMGVIFSFMWFQNNIAPKLPKK